MILKNKHRFEMEFYSFAHNIINALNLFVIFRFMRIKFRSYLSQINLIIKI